MGVLIPVQCDGERHEIEITRDGDVIVSEHDVEEELSMAAFGAELSQCLKEASYYAEDTLGRLTHFYAISRLKLTLVGTDWVEHAMWVYEANVHDMEENDLALLLKIIRDVIRYKSNMSSDEIKEEMARLERIWSELLHVPMLWHQGRTARDAVRVLISLSRRRERKLHNEAERSGDISFHDAARVFGAAYLLLSSLASEDKRGRIDLAAHFIREAVPNEMVDQEKSWQLARLVDVIEALQRGAPYPPLEATP